MKTYILVFLAGLLVGALGVLVLQETTTRTGSPTSGVTQADLENAIAKALRGVEKQIADLRESAESRLDRPAGGGAAREGTSSRSPPPPADSVEPPVRAKRPAATPRTSREPLPVANFDRLREIRRFGDDAAVRRRWLFLSEDEALDEFGAPDAIYFGDQGEERWEYAIPLGTDSDGDGEGDVEVVTLIFREQRLLRAF